MPLSRPSFAGFAARVVAAACFLLVGLIAGVPASATPGYEQVPFRPSAVPLVAHDPFFSIWSRATNLTDTHTTHWAGTADTLTGLVRIDDKPFRIIGTEPQAVPALEQTSTRVLPTRTICTFANDQIALTVTFVTPALPADLELMSTPITAVTFQAESLDGQSHEVEVFFAAGADATIGSDSELVTADRVDAGLPMIRVGSATQPVLVRSGDQIPIDWGYLYLASPQGTPVAVAPQDAAVQRFVRSGRLLTNAAGDFPRAVESDRPSLCTVIDLGRVGREAVRGHTLLAYDDIYSIEYRGSWLKGFWARGGKTIEEAILAFHTELDSLIARCEAFDAELMESMVEVGGEKFALLCALAHRQSLAGSKLCADANGMPLWFPKENSSNGCIATTDVFYPQIPHLLLLNNDLAKATAVPILDYAASDSWRFPFAPHDLGTYPHANRQVYGGGEESEENQMPVEESGNMLLICAAICQSDGNADFVDRWWPQLTQWAQYLAEHGIDPGHQLSTDDFTGHLARNVNLSVKALLGMAAYAKMAQMRGETTTARKYREIVENGVAWWMANCDAGDHYRLTFDDMPSWSQKYNLVWDELLDLNAFPESVIEKETTYYLTKLNPFGLPLDSRSRFTKTDWCLWTATLYDNRADFDAIVDPVFRFVDETPDRVPFSDWYWTHDSEVRGFIARPVIGGVFMPMLKDRSVWESWASKAEPIQGEWAPFPTPPTAVPVVATSKNDAQTWAYTFTNPGDNWYAERFDDTNWRRGPGGFGTPETPSAVIGTVWDSSDIWIRREIEIPQTDRDLVLYLHHDEDVEVYLDGKLFARMTGFTSDYRIYRLSDDQRAMLTPGRHTLALHCRQTTGGQYIDIGFATLEQE